MKFMKHLTGAAFAALMLFAGPSHAAEIEDLNIVDSSNTARFFEGMPPGSVDNGMRAVEGILARWHEDTGCRKATTGSADAYNFAAAQTLSAYYDGLLVCLEIHATNTGVSTLNIDSIGTKNVVKHGDDPLAAGDLNATFKYFMVYDGNVFQLLSQLGNAPAVTETDNNFSSDQTFVSTNATDVAAPGIDLYRNSASPAAADKGGVIRWKAEDSGGVDIETYMKQVLVIDDPADASEDGHLRIDTQVAGVLNSRWHIGDGIWADGNTNPGAGKIDADDILISGTSIPLQQYFTETDTSISAGALSSFTHGLGARPLLVQAVLQATGSDNGFVSGDELRIETQIWRQDVSGGPTDFWGATVWWDATQIHVRFANDGFRVVEASDGTEAILTLSSWDVVVRAWR